MRIFTRLKDFFKEEIDAHRKSVTCGAGCPWCCWRWRPSSPRGAQGAPLVLSLPQCIDAAFAAGTDIDILQKNLAMSREQYAIAASQSSYSLSAALGENAHLRVRRSYPPCLNSLSPGFTQSPQADITFATPTTTVGFSTTPYMPASPLAPVIAALGQGPAPGASGSFGLNVSQVLWNGYPGGTARAALDKSLLALRGRELSIGTGRLASRRR